MKPFFEIYVYENEEKSSFRVFSSKRLKWEQESEVLSSSPQKYENFDVLDSYSVLRSIRGEQK